MSDIGEALAAREREGRRLLAIFEGDGDWCPWCARLEATLAASSALDEYLEREGILGAKVGVPPRDRDEAGMRRRFGITGLPFLAFWAADGRLEGTTEYLDGGEAESYVAWLESVDSSLL